MKHTIYKIRRGLQVDDVRQWQHEIRDCGGYNTKLGMLWFQVRRAAAATRDFCKRTLWNEFALCVLGIIVLVLGAYFTAGRAQAAGEKESEPVIVNHSIGDIDRFLEPVPLAVERTIEC